MNKELRVNFRYLNNNIACMNVDSFNKGNIHNDINDKEAIIIFNSLVGNTENCQTVNTLLKENQQLKEKLDEYKKIVNILNRDFKKTQEQNYIKTLPMIYSGDDADEIMRNRYKINEIINYLINMQGLVK